MVGMVGMVGIKRALEHMAWSNQGFLAQVGRLPETVFGLRISEDEWRVGRLLTHLAGSAEWYRYILTGAEWTDLRSVRDSEGLTSLAAYLADLDAVLIAQADLPDEVVLYEDEDGPARVERSTILSQAVMHAAEHKGQIATILKANGHHVDLDELDVWSFVRR